MPETNRLLCVDDEDGVLKSLTRLFFDERYEVLTAASAREGIRLLETCSEVRVVISDYRMPDMNGAQFLRSVSARWPDTVRILLSGYADVKGVIEAINEGKIHRFVAKPWNDDELKIAVANAMEHWHLTRQNEDLAKQLKKANNDLQDMNGILRERITDEVAALKDRARTLERNSAILGNLPLAVACLDQDGWISYYNRSADALFAWNERNMMYVPRDRAFPGRVNELIDACMKNNGDSAQLETNGTVLTARCAHAAVGGSSGVILIFEEHRTRAAGRTV